MHTELRTQFALNFRAWRAPNLGARCTPNLGARCTLDPERGAHWDLECGTHWIRNTAHTNTRNTVHTELRTQFTLNFRAWRTLNLGARCTLDPGTQCTLNLEAPYTDAWSTVSAGLGTQCALDSDTMHIKLGARCTRNPNATHANTWGGVHTNTRNAIYAKPQSTVRTGLTSKRGARWRLEQNAHRHPERDTH